MPSTKKALHFMLCAQVTAVSVGVLGFGMSTTWAQTAMLCEINGTAQVTLELFDGLLNRSFCPLFGNVDRFQVFPMLSATGNAPLILHVLVVFFLALCMACSAATILIALYNSVSNPYETYMGPVGIYASSSISACLSVVVLILFAVNVNVTSMAENLVVNVVSLKPGDVDLRDKSSEMMLGYFLVIPYTVLCLVAIALIYMYDHAAYTQRREQQRPTEDAPKEIMMY